MAQTLSLSQVALHNKGEDLWIVVEGDVYDLTKFQDEHPGGKKILQRVAGKDASKQFWKYHNESILKKYKAQLQVGSLDLNDLTADNAQKPLASQAADATPKARL